LKSDVDRLTDRQTKQTTITLQAHACGGLKVWETNHKKYIII